MSLTKVPLGGNLFACCPLCSSKHYEVISEMCTASSGHDIPGAILRCKTCKMWYKLPCNNDFAQLTYNDQYGMDVATRGYMDNSYAHAFFSKVLKRVECNTGSRPLKLLDIGCGTGSLLEEAKIMGYTPEGLELCSSLAEIARKKGFLVRCMDVNDLNEIEQYDVVTAMDLIEHLSDPLRLLRIIHRILKPGGECVVYTPNHRSAVVLLAKILAKVNINFAFRNIFGTNHVCFFDDHTLSLALSSAGFRVRRLWKLPYDPLRPGMKVSLPNLAVIRGVEELGRPFGMLFRIIAFAQK